MHLEHLGADLLPTRIQATEARPIDFVLSQEFSPLPGHQTVQHAVTSWCFVLAETAGMASWKHQLDPG